MEINEKKLKTILVEQKNDYQAYVKILNEDYTKKIKIIGEGWMGTDQKVTKLSDQFSILKEKVDGVSVKLDATFELVGEMKQDIEIMKADIQFIKADLKKFIKAEEFDSLEKRVILLERKLNRT